jgi:hypothetical protein
MVIVIMVYLHLKKKLSIYQLSQKSRIGKNTIRRWVKRSVSIDRFIGELNRRGREIRNGLTLLELYWEKTTKFVEEVFGIGVSREEVDTRGSIAGLSQLYCQIFSFFYPVLTASGKRAVIV